MQINLHTCDFFCTFAADFMRPACATICITMKTLSKFGVLFALCALASNLSAAQIRTESNTQNTTEDPPCRYESLNGLKGQALREALQAIIAPHEVLTYSQIRADQVKVDVDEDGRVIDMYSDCAFGIYDYCGNRTDYTDCECYNREHSLPKSFWGGSKDEPMYTDLHHVIPTDFVANSQRSAWIYDEVKTPTWTNDVSTLGYGQNFPNETVFEPADKYKGDFARIYFYMLTCYRDKNFTVGGKGFRIFNYSNDQTDFKNTALNLMLKWHRNDPVSQKEIDRNEKIAVLQGNRNPFVDDPNLVEYIWAKPTTGYECSGSTTPPDPDPEEIVGALTCADASEQALALPVGSHGSETVTVVGYVTEILYEFGNGMQSYWMADTPDGGRVFEGYKARADEAVYLGYKVALTGTLYNYQGIPEIKDGTTKILERGSEAIEERPTANDKRHTTVKFIRDGHLYILVNGVTYNVQGQKVE